MATGEIMSNIDRQEITAGKEIVNIAGNFSPEQQKNAGEKIKQGLKSLENPTEDKDSPEKISSDRLKQLCEEGNRGVNTKYTNKTVDNYLTTTKGYPGPHKQF